MKKIGQLYRERLVKHMKDGVTGNDNVFLLSYSKVSGLQMSDLRKSLNQNGATMCVTKNSVIQLALNEIEQKELAEKISGQTALIWGGADSSEVSKILVDFMKQSEDIIVQGGLLQGKPIEKDDVKKLSELPSRKVLLSMLLSTIQAPLTRLAGALNAKTRDLVSVLKQLSERSEQVPTSRPEEQSDEGSQDPSA